MKTSTRREHFFGKTEELEEMSCNETQDSMETTANG